MSLPKTAIKKKTTGRVTAKHNAFPIVAIGASAGGLEAISTLLKALPANTGMAYIYVQHLSPDHKSLLTSILSKITKMKVQEIENMEHIEANNVYVIPNDKGIEVIDGHIQLVPRLKNNASNLTIDVLFSSLAFTHKDNVVGVVLSGYASDGAKGLKAIKDAGGLTFAQDESAQASSMPQSAIASGAVDFIMSPVQIAHQLVLFSKNGFKHTTNKSLPLTDEIEGDNNDLKTIFDLLHKQTGADFSHYKMTTIKRRLKHRMLHCGIKTIKEFSQYLQKNINEVDFLYEDFLIHVTSFFRETESYNYLQKTFLPKLLNGKKPDESLRIWVPACSTGQEAYSIAMLVAELQRNKLDKIPVQIFATDLSEQAIKEARAAEYTQSDLSKMDKKRVNRFFTKTNDKYSINKEIREMCLFAPHNILRDPPFSRVDFISCCNLLIYLDAPAQKRILATLNFALNEGGHLMLGKSETIGTSTHLFSLVNNKHKIYLRKKSTGLRKMPELLPRFPAMSIFDKNAKITAHKTTSIDAATLDKSIDSVLLSQYMPACAIINKDMEIVQFRGSTSLFLEHSSGKASLNILKMIKPEFAFDLRNMILKAIKTKLPVRKTGIEMKIGADYKTIALEICPLTIEWDEPLLLVVFTIQEQIDKIIGISKGQKTGPLAIGTKQQEQKIKSLVDELNHARAEMHAIIQSQETAYEELQAANEEITSTNEEFQTLNEELETSKEEIEATNEELITTNQELQMRNELLTESYEYSEAIIATLHEPMIILDKNLRVKSANESFYTKFQVNRTETEGKLIFSLGNKQWDIEKLHELLEDIISKNIDFQSFQVTHTFPKIGERIMLLNAHRIVQKTHREQSILLAFEDITERTHYYLNEKAILNREKQIAELAVNSKQQFLSNMSHEIRTPMNAIIGFTKVVLKTELTEKQKEYVNAIKISGDALIVLINDILDLAKVDAGKMTFEHAPFKIMSSVNVLLHMFETKMQEKNLELIKEYDNKIPEWLIGDSVRLNQIILNLMSNAVKFTIKGKIIIGMHLLQEDEKTVTLEFSVADTGIGIPENNLVNIFEKFQQATSGTARLYGGTGLGLAIVKQLVEAQGGTIAVKSKIDQGTIFSFTLSFQKAKNITEFEDETIELDSETKNIKVLVVEDIPLNQLLLKTILDDFGFERDIADNGKIAIEKLQQKSYDIILMDLQMPEMNGFEATEFIRNQMNSKIPIIALTADVTTVDLKKCKAIGMNDYIAKPVDEKLLYSKIIRLVKKQKKTKPFEEERLEQVNSNKTKYTNLTYLLQRTKANPALVMEMISLYLEQTPSLVSIMKQSYQDKNWPLLYSAVHKMIPSFGIMGIDSKFEQIAKTIQDKANAQSPSTEMPELIATLENVCEQACVELKEEFNQIKSKGL